MSYSDHQALLIVSSPLNTTHTVTVASARLWENECLIAAAAIAGSLRVGTRLFLYDAHARHCWEYTVPRRGRS